MSARLLQPVYFRILLIVALLAAWSAVVVRAAELARAVAPVCAAEAADEQSASAMAAVCRSTVEIAAARTETTQVFARPDGSRRLISTIAPQRVRRADGSWTPISTKLTRRADGRFGPVATLADVTFSPGGAGALVAWREESSTFTLGWPLGALPAPRIVGDSAIYESVLPDVNLHVIATAAGFTHSVEVRTLAAARNASIRSLSYLTGGDIRVSVGANGTARLVDPGGRTVASSAGARMWDSSNDPALAGEVLPEVVAERARGVIRLLKEPATAHEPAVTSRTARVGLSHTGSRLTVTPDAALLAHPGLTYPIFIDPPFEKARAKWAYESSNNENNDSSSARVGRQPSPDGNGEMYRSFFNFDVSALKSKKIISTTLRMVLDHSYSCSDTYVTLHRVEPITVAHAARMNWGTRPTVPATWIESWAGHANESGGCGVADQGDMTAEFTGGTFRTSVQQTADARSATYAVGLCACNPEGQFENDQARWKRFYNGGTTTMPTLEIIYDSVPTAPTNLTTSGQACGSTIGTSSPVFKAYYADVDGAADSLTGFFEYQQLPSGTVVALTGQVRPGNNYGESGTVSLGTGSEGKTYQWRVRTRDLANFYSPWSSWCSFTVDVSKPPMPGVSSTLYPDDGVAHGGPGISGSFTFTAGAQDVVKYVYGWAGQTNPLTTVTVAAGASYTVTLTPPEHGINTLNVYSMDGANKQSDTNAYEFLTGTPSALKAHWPLDTIDAHNYNDQAGTAHLTPSGGVTWTPDARYIGESSLSLDGSGYLSTAGPVLDTSKSFSVSAWARIDELATEQIIVAQAGTNRSRFMLYYSASQGAWRFYMYHNDDLVDQSGSGAAGPVPVVGEWTHLTGVYDAGTKRISLYVNGVIASTVSHSSLWNAPGSMSIGRRFVGSSPTGSFKGEIADVRVWQRVVVLDDLWGTDADAAAGTQARPGVLSPTEVASWDFNGGVSSVCGPTTSATYWSQQLSLVGCTDPYSPAQTAGYTGDDHNGNDALWLNHTQPDGNGTTVAGGHAVTSGPMMRTDQSFTVAAWVKLVQTGSDQVVVAQTGTVRARFLLYYSENHQSWRFYMYDADDAGTAGNATGAAPPQLNQWVHLAGVYDAAANRIRLYVNGDPAGTASHTPTWDAGGQFYVGRTRTNGSLGARLHGTVDQVKVFVGALSDREVAALHDNS